MSAGPPDTPPEPSDEPEETPPRRTPAWILTLGGLLGAVVAILAVFGGITLVVGGICAAILSGTGG